MENTKQHIKNLIEKAAKAEKSEDVMRLSQAALNAAHAVIGLTYLERDAT